MKWIAATVSTAADVSLQDHAVGMLSDVFYGLGLKGVLVDESPINEGNTVRMSVTGYFPHNDSFEDNRSCLESSVRTLSVDGSSPCQVSYREIDEEDWADSWKAHFYPQRIGRHIIVKPTWREFPGGADDIVVEIDPGMAFGTGTHATTRMCLIMLERYVKHGMTFLDIGTGSGILMAAAFKLGAASVRGVDNDPVAVEIARANLVLNRVPADKGTVVSADLVDGMNRTFDLVCANILAEVVTDLIPDINSVLEPGGCFVCSGIIASKRRMVEQQLLCSGFLLVDQITEEDWVCLAAARDTAAG